MGIIQDMELNQNEIIDSLVTASVYIPNTSYEMLLNMPVTEKNQLIKAYNKKAKKESEQ